MSSCISINVRFGNATSYDENKIRFQSILEMFWYVSEILYM